MDMLMNDEIEGPIENGKMEFKKENQGNLNMLMTSNHYIEEASDLRTLVIEFVSEIPPEWPKFYRLEDLTIKVDETLKRFPSQLKASVLPALRSLTLSYKDNTGSNRRASPVLKGKFEKLETIAISGFAMEGGAIENLLLQPQLTVLKFQGNGIGAGGCKHLAQGLKEYKDQKLTRLFLLNNKIGDEGCKSLAEALKLNGACSKLTHLSLEGNSIGNKGCEHLVGGLLKGCRGLQELDLSRNNIDALPGAMKELGSVTSLNISINRIKRIQSALYGLILGLNDFQAKYNPLEDPPEEVSDQGLDVLKRYLEDIRGRGRMKLPTARIMLLGDSEHGKTSLCRSLPRGVPCPRVKPDDRTHALEIHDWIITRSEKEPLTIKLWDFAGHRVYYATHRSFFSRLSIYVLVAKIDVDDDKMQGVIDTSTEWLMSICKVLRAEAQVVLVGTFPHDQREKNEEALRENLDLLKEQLAKADEERVRVWNKLRSTDGEVEEAKPAKIYEALWVDCHSDNDNNLGPIAAKLKELAEKMVHDKQEFSGSYIETLQVHKQLYSGTKAGVSSLQGFRSRMTDGTPDNVMRDALKFGNDVGILQYYPAVNKDIVYIDPLFLVQAFGVLIHDKKAYERHIAGVRERWMLVLQSYLREAKDKVNCVVGAVMWKRRSSQA